MSQKHVYGRHFLSEKPIRLTIDSGIISDITEEKAAASLKDIYLAPGLIDIQVNGCAGIDFSSDELTVDQVIEITRLLWEKGVTSYLPTLITSPPEVYQHALDILKHTIKRTEINGSIPGIHLEGPYISQEQGYRGAHDLTWIKNPDWHEFLAYNKRSGEQIKQITLAPELPGGMEFIQNCIQKGIVTAIGHHHAEATLISEAAAAGARLATHLGNACANLIKRHDNVLWPQLAEDRLMASVIMDGHHLNRYEATVFLRAKGVDNLILISDMTKFAGLSPGTYTWYNSEINVSQDGKISKDDQNILAGSTAHLKTGIMNMHLFSGCSIGQAILMASRNPARLIRLSDRGELKVGQRADICVFEIQQGELEILQTFVNGTEVYKA